MLMMVINEMMLVIIRIQMLNKKMVRVANSKMLSMRIHYRDCQEGGEIHQQRCSFRK